MRQVRDGVDEDVPSWLELADEVRALFGPMPDIEEHIRRAILRGTAVVAVDDRTVIGATLLSPDGEPHCIRWLSVRSAHRRTGVGNLLLQEILRRWPDGDIEVTTFGPDVPGGAPARHLYARHGFRPEGPTDRGPDGTSRVRYALRR